MPIYEYKCQQCGQVSEVFQKFSDEPLSDCPCGGEMKKLISLNSFHLKGSGWYVTDYGRGKGGGDGKKTSPDSKAASDKPASTEKPAATTKTDSTKTDSAKSDD